MQENIEYFIQNISCRKIFLEYSIMDLMDFIIKELAEELERKCNCLGEDTEK